MKKTYVLDTNVLIQDPLALYKFDDNEVVIPDTVIEELDRLKKREGDIGYNARKTIKEIEHIRENRRYTEWCNHKQLRLNSVEEQIVGMLSA